MEDNVVVVVVVEDNVIVVVEEIVEDLLEIDKPELEENLKVKLKERLKRRLLQLDSLEATSKMKVIGWSLVR